MFNPAGTQSWCNVEIWSKLQRWKLVAISILNQRWNTVDTSTLTVVEKWLSVWCFRDFEIMSVSCLFPSPHSIYLITIMLMQLNQILQSRWTDTIIHGCALSPVRCFWTLTSCQQCAIVCTDNAVPHIIASVVIPNVYGRRPACCTENWSSYEWTLDRSDNWAGIGAFPENPWWSHGSNSRCIITAITSKCWNTSKQHNVKIHSANRIDETYFKYSVGSITTIHSTDS